MELSDNNSAADDDVVYNDEALAKAAVVNYNALK